MPIIRSAHHDDLSHLARIERSAASCFRDTDLAWIADGDTTDPAILAELCVSGTLWIAASEEDEPIGFLAAHELDGDLHIAEVSVAGPYQKQGIGAAIIGAAEAYARANRFGAVTLTTNRDIPWNGPFYRKLGFIEVNASEAGPGHLSRLRAQADAGHDLLKRCIMAKRLHPRSTLEKMQFAISNLRDCPFFGRDVADRVWRAWWQKKGYPLDYIESRLQENLASDAIPLALIAHDGDRFLGTASVISSDLQERPTYTPWVAAVWVDPENRSSGVGSALVRAAAQAALQRGFDIVYLCARSEKRLFYENLGWKQLEDGVGRDCLTVLTFSQNLEFRSVQKPVAKSSFSSGIL